MLMFTCADMRSMCTAEGGATPLTRTESAPWRLLLVDCPIFLVQKEPEVLSRDAAACSGSQEALNGFLHAHRTSRIPGL